MTSTEQGSSTKTVTLAAHGRQLSFEALLDDGSHYVLDEIFNKHCYELVPFIGEVKTIVDIGANMGIASAWFRLSYPQASILAFEPDPRALTILQKNAAAIGKIELHPFGLYSEDCTKDFFVGKTSTVHSSIHSHKYSSATNYSIDLKDAGSVLQNSKIGAIDIIKIDTEGCEIAILRSIGKAIDGIKVIYLEFHSENDRRELDDLLCPTHQLYEGSIMQAHRGQMTYVRRDLLENQHNPEIEPLNMAANIIPISGKPASSLLQLNAATLGKDPKLSSSQLGRYLAEYSAVDGWFSPESAAIWDCLLSHQTQTQMSGNFLEIGVWRGKSAALSTLHSKADESCILVDPFMPNEVRTLIDGIKPENVVYAEKYSTELLRTGLLTTNAHTFRWIHIDGEHSGPAIMNDLNIANALLNEKGVLVLDDFFSTGYPQITAAVFQWLQQHPLQLHLFLCGLNKGYLCRTNTAPLYLQFVKDRLHTELARRGFSNLTIWKTTTTADMNCFGISERFQNFSYRGPDWDQNRIQI